MYQPKSNTEEMPHQSHLLGFWCSTWSPGILWCSILETVGKLAGDSLEVTSASGTGGLSSLGLLAPVVYFHHVSTCPSAHYLLLLLQSGRSIREMVRTYTCGS